MICKCVMAWCRRRLLERMYTRSCLLIVGAPHHKKNKLQPDSRHLNLALLQLKKTFNVFDTFCDFCSSQNDKICWLLSLLLDVLRKDLISWSFWFFKMFWTYHADLRALFFCCRLFLFWLKWFVNYFGAHQWSPPVTKSEWNYARGNFYKLMTAILCSTLFAHFSLAATSAFCTFRLIKGIWEYTQHVLSKWYTQ